MIKRSVTSRYWRGAECSTTDIIPGYSNTTPQIGQKIVFRNHILKKTLVKYLYVDHDLEVRLS